ncbi:DUF4944 domain-containing protein [Neobacillus sp. KR4-4]|uniref:DUF4944 domain-containing protein n=1 Tax=Neobacillus sp. KR4-4 TaxID=3344872 RepID=UPI0035CC8B45
MTRKRLFLFILTAVLLVAVAGWKIYDYRQWKYPRWEGISKDGNWKAIIAKDRNASPLNVFGNAYWVGDKKDLNKTFLTFVQFRVDGKYYTGDKKEKIEKRHQLITNPDNMGFLDFGDAEDFKNKELIVELHWTKEGEEKNTKIELKKVVD